MVPSCLPVRFVERFLKALVGPRMQSAFVAVLVLALGTGIFIRFDPQDLSFIDALCRLTSDSNRKPQPTFPRL